MSDLRHDGCGGVVQQNPTQEEIEQMDDQIYGTSYHCENCDEKIHPTDVIPAGESDECV